MWFNLALTLQETARRYADKIALTAGEGRVSYAELDAAANRVANALRALGVQQGEKVAIMLPNAIEFPMVFYGVLKAGGVAVLLNAMLKAGEIQHILTDSGAAALLAWDGCADIASEALVGVPSCRHLLRVPGDDRTGHGASSLAALLPQVSPACDMAAVAPGDTALIFYTSGTTGQPKGVEHSHLAAFLWAVNRVPVERGLGEKSVSLAVFPFSFLAGLMNLLTIVYVGGRLVLLERFDPARALAAIERERVTTISAVPHAYARLVAEMERGRYDVSSLVSCSMGGAPPTRGLLEAIERAFAVIPRVSYASTETGTVATTPADVRPAPGCVGRPWWGVEVRIGDDDDNPLPPGVLGEILVRSPMVMKGYYERPQETAEALRNGWLHTGDIGYLDESGYLYVIDRKKTMINRGGFKVYPAEVERVLLTHPAVAEAAVVGVPDSVRGEEVKAYVVLKPGMAVTADEIVAYCRQRLASYKLPRLVEFRTHLPRNPQGKVVRSDL